MRIIPVTGMHRSGTSMVARILHILGVDLGPQDGLLPAADDNPTGFWENQRIKRLNDRILDTLGGTWRLPPIRPPGWTDNPELDDLRTEARALVTTLFEGAEPAGWKDPRTSLLIPFWRSVIQIDHTVLVLREPLSVATSLARRNGLEAEQSAYLWLRYTAAAWFDDPDHVLVDHRDMVSSPVREAARLGARLGLELDDASADRIGRFVVPHERPTDGHASREKGALMALAEDVYERIPHESREALEPTMRVLADGWLSNIGEGLYPEMREYANELKGQMEHAQQTAGWYHTLMAKRIVRLALAISEWRGGARVPRPEEARPTYPDRHG